MDNRSSAVLAYWGHQFQRGIIRNMDCRNGERRQGREKLGASCVNVFGCFWDLILHRRKDCIITWGGAGMTDLDKIIKNMTDEVTAAIVESCAKCAEIHLMTPESREQDNGYVK